MALANKHETFMRQIKVLADMVGAELVLNSNATGGWTLHNKSGVPMFDGKPSTKGFLQEKVLFAISALRLRQLVERDNLRKKEREDVR